MPSSGFELCKNLIGGSWPEVLVSFGLLIGNGFSWLFILKRLSPYLLSSWDNLVARLWVYTGESCLLLVETFASWLHSGVGPKRSQQWGNVPCSLRCSVGRRDCSCLSTHFPVWNIYNPDSFFQALSSQAPFVFWLGLLRSFLNSGSMPRRKMCLMPFRVGIHPEGGGCKLKCLWAKCPSASWLNKASQVRIFFLREVGQSCEWNVW